MEGTFGFVELQSLEQSLAAAERSVQEGRGLSGTGFWRAVAAVKRNPDLVDRYAERIAAIDQAAFKHWALLVVPFRLGTVLAVLAVVIGLVAIGLAYPVEGFWSVVLFFGGLGALLPSSHGLAHLVTGRLLSIRFTAWFVGSVSRPQPGVKVDYVSYLRAPARARAWMHASGAIVTKLVPFSLIGAAIASGQPVWAVWALVAFGVVALLADLFWSTKSSDWMRFRREIGS